MKAVSQKSLVTSNTTARPSSAPAETAAADAEKERKLAAAKKLREQREQEKASRLRLQKRLEAHRPETSASGKHPAAQATDVLFDFVSKPPQHYCHPYHGCNWYIFHQKKAKIYFRENWISKLQISERQYASM